jgi:hypothetical protein
LVEPKFWRNIHLAPWPTALGVPAGVSHGVRGAANGRRYWSVGPGPDAAAHGATGRWGQVLTPRPTASENPCIVGHDVRTLAPWLTAAAPAYIRGRAPARQPLIPPSLLPPNLRLSTSSPSKPTLRSASDVCFLNLVRCS